MLLACAAEIANCYIVTCLTRYEQRAENCAGDRQNRGGNKDGAFSNSLRHSFFTKNISLEAPQGVNEDVPLADAGIPETGFLGLSVLGFHGGEDTGNRSKVQLD